MGFLVGNDFIPHLPGFHISSGALPVLFKAYCDVLPTLNGMIAQVLFYFGLKYDKKI